jgi:hypothetical protein
VSLQCSYAGSSANELPFKLFKLISGSSDSIVDRPRAAKRLIANFDKRFGKEPTGRSLTIPLKHRLVSWLGFEDRPALVQFLSIPSVPHFL